MARPGRAATWCIGVVDRYQASGQAAHFDGRCPYEPSCSTFLVQVFATRAFPLAFAAAAWRLMRCNPLVSRRASDPVLARGRRPNGLRTAFSLTVLIGGLWLMVAPAALAQTNLGGCVVLINNREPTSMTLGSPVRVQRGGQISIRVEADERMVQETTEGNGFVRIIFTEDWIGLGATVHKGHFTQGVWTGSVATDKYFRVAGIYKVEGTALGADGSGRMMACTATGYVKLNDNVLDTPIGQGALGGAALTGPLAIAARAKGKPGAGDVPPPPEEPPVGGGAPPAPPEIPTDPNARVIADRSGLTCCLLLPMALLLPVGSILGMSGGAVTTAARPPLQRTMWRRGHGILGFIFGTLFGLFVSILLQQFAIWPFSTMTLIVFPLAVGLLLGIRAWVGTKFRLTYIR